MALLEHECNTLKKSFSIILFMFNFKINGTNVFEFYFESAACITCNLKTFFKLCRKDRDSTS